MAIMETIVGKEIGATHMTDRVREIVSWYESDNPGSKTNIARLLTHGYLAGTGKLVILPVDQGFEHGPARSFAINLAQVSVADSYALGALAGAYNMVRQAGGRVKFFAAPERLIRALRKFHLDSVLELYTDETSALSNLQ